MFLFFFFASLHHSWSDNTSFVRKVVQKDLSSVIPTLIGPPSLNEENFHVSWVNASIPHVEVNIVDKSLQWTRMKHGLAIPRAQLHIKGKTIDSGSVHYAGFTHPITNGKAEVPIALISGKKNAVQLEIQRGENVYRKKLKVVFQEYQQKQENVYFGSSCSSYFFEKIEEHLSDSWVYFSCRVNMDRRNGQFIPNLEVYLYWDQKNSIIHMNDTPLKEVAPSVYRFKVGKWTSRKLSFKSNHQKFSIQYSLPEKVNLGRVAMGLGPYHYLFEDGAADVKSLSPLMTLYFSYKLSDSSRLVSFEATSFHPSFFSDLGIYFLIEQGKFFDNRAKLNLLFGGHTLIFKSRDSTYFRPSAPQGFEILFKDFLEPRRTLGLGGFINPGVSGHSYWNVWIRWGGPYFVELNYIAFKEPLYKDTVFARSLGLMVGFPLFGF